MMFKHDAKREQWLYAVAEALFPMFAEFGFDTPPPFRIGVGYCKSRRHQLGLCSGRAGKPHELTIAPTQDDAISVAATLCHEMIHSYLFQEYGVSQHHNRRFRSLAAKFGLKMVSHNGATVAEDAFIQRMQPILEQLGDYPHAALELPPMVPKDSTRLLKVQCAACGYTLRVTRKWLAVGIPKCPNRDCAAYGVDCGYVVIHGSLTDVTKEGSIPWTA